MLSSENITQVLDDDDADKTEDYNIDDYFTKLFSVSDCTNCLPL